MLQNRRMALAALAAAALPLLAITPEQFRRHLARDLAKSPALWGISIVDLDTGRTFYTSNESKLLVPASNTKLFTTALALERLGPDHRFVTRVLAPEAPGADGVVRGDLVLSGGGDPNLSARALPYRHDDDWWANALAPVNDLAVAIVGRGVRHITGGIVGDDTRYPSQPFPDGWAIDDAAYDYGSPVSALVFNDNAVRLTVHGGDPPSVDITPIFAPLLIHNRVSTGTGGLRLLRTPLATELVIAGEAAEGRSEEAILAAPDPALFAARALEEALRARGVRIDGAAAVRHRRPGEPEPPAAGIELARRDSAPIADAVSVVNKVSQNLHAEMLLREVSRVRRGSGSLEDGLEELKQYLAEIGIRPDDYRFEDGSGLSRLNQVTPAAVTRLLLRLWNSPLRKVWVATLPVGGLDGTLDDRFGKDPRGAFVHAKTGTVSHVSALSGYVLPAAGRRYAFSILVNGYSGDAEETRALTDKIVLYLIRRSR